MKEITVESTKLNIKETRWNRNEWIVKKETAVFCSEEREQREINKIAFVVVKMLGAIQ
jgi:hypothetical protein